MNTKMLAVLCMVVVAVSMIGCKAKDSSSSSGPVDLITPDLKYWNFNEGSWEYQDGILARTGKGDIWTKQQYGNFVLELEFKIAKKSNSGVLIRCIDPEDWMNTALEVQIHEVGDGTQHGQTGGVYDCKSPDFYKPANLKITDSKGNEKDFPFNPNVEMKLEDGAIATVEKFYRNMRKALRKGKIVYYEGSDSQFNPGIILKITKTDGTAVEEHVDTQEEYLLDDGKYKVEFTWVEMIEDKAVKTPAEQWHKMKVTAVDNIIKTELNGKQVMVMNLDQYAQAGINPQGTPNKYTVPVKDIARKGYIGLQDHGLPVWFRNVRLTSLDK